MKIKRTHIPGQWPILALILLSMAGCASFKTDSPGDHRADAYAQSNLDELLGFGSNFAQQTSAARAETCRFLLNRQKEAPGAGVQLHLLTGRLLSDSCGDIPKILAGVESIPAKDLPDEPVRRLVAIHMEALKRMNHASRRPASLERKQKTVQSVPESKDPKASPKAPPKGAKASKTDEARLLRDKLEAIRAMEKKLDDAGEGN